MIVHVVHECFSTNDAGSAKLINCLVFFFELLNLEVYLNEYDFT